MSIFNDFLASSVLFVGALFTLIVCLPLFNQVIGLLPFGGSVVLFASILVVVLVVFIVYLFVNQNLGSINRARRGEGGVFE